MSTPDRNSDLYPGLDEALDTALERHAPKPPPSAAPPRVSGARETLPLDGEIIFQDNNSKENVEKFPRIHELGRVALSGIIDLEILPKDKHIIKKIDHITSLEKIKNGF